MNCLPERGYSQLKSGSRNNVFQKYQEGRDGSYRCSKEEEMGKRGNMSSHQVGHNRSL